MAVNWDERVHGALLAGDEAALGEAYDALVPFVYGIALRATGSGLTAEELTEKVFVRLWERPAEFAPERGTLRAQLCVLARRWALERARKIGVPPSRALTRAGAHEGGARAALLSLPAEQRDAIMLVYFHGLNYRQVAGELGISEDRARAGLHRGLGRMAELRSRPAEQRSG